tara:strand:- start:344 stop:463 length:120 start_codon:yes stop_codon:yes gene_type:complete
MKHLLLRLLAALALPSIAGDIGPADLFKNKSLLTLTSIE